MPGLTFETTPNPLAIKCVTPSPLVDAPAPFRSMDAAAGEGRVRALARDLLAIPGVAHVLLHPMFITIARTPDARWASIKPRVSRVIEAALRDAASPDRPA